MESFVDIENQDLIIKLKITIESMILKPSSIGLITAPSMHYQTTFGLINDLIRKINRIGIETFQVNIIDKDIKINDTHSDNIQIKNYMSFAPTDFFIKNASNTSTSGSLMYNDYINTYNTKIKLSEMIEILKFISSSKNNCTIKLPSISPLAIYELLIILSTSFKKIRLWKPEDDIWIIDSFYVSMEQLINKNIITSLLEQLQNLKPKDNDRYLISILDIFNNVNKEVNHKIHSFYNSVIDGVLPRLIEVMKLIE